MNTPAILALEDGTLFHGQSIGAAGIAVGEVCFNTAMVGYSAILTDPAYRGLLVTLTYPHAGNVGMAALDAESATAHAQGLIVRDLALAASNWRAEQSLGEYLRGRGVVAISEIDTRKLTRILREGGTQRACIMTDAVDPEAALAHARGFEGLQGQNLVAAVSTEQSYPWLRGCWQLGDGLSDSSEQDPSSLPYHVVVLDLGVNRSTLRLLVDAGCRLTVVSAQSSAAEIMALQPSGVLLAGGPGDPVACVDALATVRELLEQSVPILGLGLGHALLALASGARTVKMKLGSYGANHPVQDLATQRVEITQQSHSFMVDETSLPQTLQATHRSLFDGSLQGVQRTDRPVLGFQGMPEASFNAREPAPLIARFLELMTAAK